MPSFFPFKALRPNPKFVEQVTAKSTDFEHKADLIEEIRSNPYTYHHVTKGHLSYSGAYQQPEKFLPFAAQYIQKMKSTEVLIRDTEDSFYIYEQTRKDGRKFAGIIGLSSVEDYKNEKIKKHEAIRPSNLKFLVELFKTTKVMGEPTLLAHHSPIDLSAYDGEELYDFKTVDEKRHQIRIISNPKHIADIQDRMAGIDDFYIADGHHRSASAAEFNALVPSLENKASMCFVLHENQLEILPFHRLIKSIVRKGTDELLHDLSKFFKVTTSSDPLYQITEVGIFGLYTENQWYKLQLLQTDEESTDIEMLEEHVIKETFGIKDSRTDSQIAFHPHTEGLHSLVNLVDQGTYNFAFTSKPCTFEEIRRTSDAAHIMPPKSTYIEPKLRAGLIIQEFDIKK